MPTFSFDAERHAYIAHDTGEQLPHITGLLEVDDLWLTPESRVRGSIVHRLTADYDLGALDVASCVSEHKAYLLAHVHLMTMVEHEWIDIERPRVHWGHRFGGRPDRVGFVDKVASLCEIKSGQPEKHHQVQTALQAILVAPDLNLPPDAIRRHVIYLKPDGRAKFLEHDKRADYDRAYEAIRKHCRTV